MNHAAIASSSEPGRASRAAPLHLAVDIIIVATVSVLTFVLEDLASARGWISIGAEARGVSSVLVGAFTAVGLVLARGGSLADLGFKRPERWSLVPLQVAGILAVFVAAQSLVPLLVSMVVEVPAPDLSRFDSINGNLGAAIALALVLPLTASIPEEIIYRGFLIGRLSEIFGRGVAGSVLTVVVQALLFGSVHFLWGVGGVVVTFMMGLVWGTAYVLCNRNLWVVILAHSAGHVLFATQLYLGTSIII